MCRVRLPPTVFGSLWIFIFSFLVVLCLSGLRAGFGLLLCLASLVYALRALVEWQSVLSLADEAKPKLLDSDPCFLVIAFSLACMPMLSGVHTVWPSGIRAKL